MMIGFGIFTWIGSSVPTRFKFKKNNRFGDMYFIVTQKNKEENLIDATILTGPYEGEAVLIPRIHDSNGSAFSI